MTLRKKPLLVPLLCLVSLCFSSPFASSSEQGKFIDLVLTDLNGKKVGLGSLAAGKPLLIYLWATWCKPCRKTQPQVADIHKKYNHKIMVVGINVGGVDSREDIKKYKARHRIAYTMLIDRDDAVVKTYRIFTIPTIILFDRDGRTLYRGNGPPTNLENLLPE